jgi:threonine dehydrogenase-like Zn-dependent dehydrogenase
MSLHSGGKGITGIASMALKNPELAHKAIEMVKRDGISKTIDLIKGQTGKLSPLGYSSSGVVLEVGKTITDIAVGDRVACAGAGYANHAEIVSVPRNLLCKMPDNVNFDETAFATVGAIAMQGIRRAEVQFGDNVVVIGLGLLGQIASQILKAAGAHVIGIDIMKERAKLAKELEGADICFTSGKDAVDKVMEYTDGIGADSVIIYAATSSNEPVKQSMQIARKKGRVVVVGAVGMKIDRSPFYEKELDFLISCSYGPGRYDPLYEEKGVDYPIGYVRWTENRNM